MASKYDIVVFSPHLDDAALSCSGRIVSERRMGKRVMVATLFSAGDTSKESKEVYQERRKEDQQAMRALGVEYVLFDFKDAPCRNSFYSSFERLFLEEAKTDEIFQKEVTSKVKALCDDVQPAIALFPLAIGGHIDHRLTHRAHAAVKGQTAIEFYEDRPYVFLRKSINYRLRAMNARPASPAQSGALETVIPVEENDVLGEVPTMMRSIEEVEFYKRVLPPGKDRFRILLRLAQELKEEMQGTNKLRLEPRLFPVDATIYDSVKNAVLSYPSQIEGIFGTAERWEKESTAYTAQILEKAKYAERTWRLLV
jgi:LmbE family N-acetylglucosaminyl deacetylase